MDEHKAGFVGLLGVPNVGKSTLMNALVGESLAVANAKAQTTRHRILGIQNGETYQIVYADTPGVLIPNYALQENMLQVAQEVFRDADVLLWIVAASATEVPAVWQQKLHRRNLPTILVINKMDLIEKDQQPALIKAWTQRIQATQVVPISAFCKTDVQRVEAAILAHLPVHPPYYPKDTLTDRSERFFAQEILRGKILAQYHQEIPYSSTVVVERFKESEDIIHIYAVIHVERRSQKAILIGKEGGGLKRLGTDARMALEAFFGKKIFLAQHVKVTPDWRKKAHQLARFGYQSGE